MGVCLRPTRRKQGAHASSMYIDRLATPGHFQLTSDPIKKSPAMAPSTQYLPSLFDVTPKMVGLCDVRTKNLRVFATRPGRDNHVNLPHGSENRQPPMYKSTLKKRSSFVVRHLPSLCARQNGTRTAMALRPLYCSPRSLGYTFIFDRWWHAHTRLPVTSFKS